MGVEWMGSESEMLDVTAKRVAKESIVVWVWMVERWIDKVSEDPRLAQAPLLTFLPFPLQSLLTLTDLLRPFCVHSCYCFCEFTRKSPSTRAVWRISESESRKEKKMAEAAEPVLFVSEVLACRSCVHGVMHE
jgi:hypothetical protein